MFQPTEQQHLGGMKRQVVRLGPPTSEQYVPRLEREKLRQQFTRLLQYMSRPAPHPVNACRITPQRLALTHHGLHHFVRHRSGAIPIQIDLGTHHPTPSLALVNTSSGTGSISCGSLRKTTHPAVRDSAARACLANTI